MNTFQTWLWWLLGSTWRLEPYHTASARPGPPALIHGNTLVASPLAVRPSLTCNGAVHCVHPVAALAPLTNVCLRAGSELLTAHTAIRLRAVSMERTEKSVSGESLVSAILTSFVRSWPDPVASRK